MSSAICIKCQNDNYLNVKLYPRPVCVLGDQRRYTRRCPQSPICCSLSSCVQLNPFDKCRFQWNPSISLPDTYFHWKIMFSAETFEVFRPDSLGSLNAGSTEALDLCKRSLKAALKSLVPESSQPVQGVLVLQPCT